MGNQQPAAAPQRILCNVEHVSLHGGVYTINRFWRSTIVPPKTADAVVLNVDGANNVLSFSSADTQTVVVQVDAIAYEGDVQKLRIMTGTYTNCEVFSVDIDEQMELGKKYKIVFTPKLWGVSAGSVERVTDNTPVTPGVGVI